MIPPGRDLRIVGDVHGDSKAFALAADTGRFVVQLGDLVDDGPDTPGALKIMFRLIDAGQGMFLLGNHDFKLARALRGDKITPGPGLRRTLAELDPDLAARVAAEVAKALAWCQTGPNIFVHGGFHPAMLYAAAPAFPTGRPDALMARALYGQTTGRVTGEGRPERVLHWVDKIPAGMTVYCGHDNRSADGRPYIRTNEAGGKAVFLDTGAGKGGHLSWIDLPAIT